MATSHRPLSRLSPLFPPSSASSSVRPRSQSFHTHSEYIMGKEGDDGEEGRGVSGAPAFPPSFAGGRARRVKKR